MTSLTPPEDQLRQAAAAAHESGFGRQLAILAVGSALFMQFIDQTALSTALPPLARAFDIEPMNTRRAPKRSAAQPLADTTTACTNM